MSKQYLTKSEFWNWPGWQIFKWILGLIILAAVLSVIYQYFICDFLNRIAK